MRRLTGWALLFGLSIVLGINLGCETSPPGQGLTNPTAEPASPEKPAISESMPAPADPEISEVEAAVSGEVPGEPP